MDKHCILIHSNTQLNNQNTNYRNDNLILKYNRILPRQLTTLKICDKIKIVKLFLSIVLLFSATVIVSVSNPNQSAYAVSFGSTKNLSNNDGDSKTPQIEASGNNVYAVWGDSSKGG